jgi:poly(A) polymerase
MSEKLSQYDVSKEIDVLLESNNATDEIEEKARDIISNALYKYAVDELKKDANIKNPEDEIAIENTNKLTKEIIDENFEKFKEKINDESRLKFIEELSKKFPQGKIYIVGGSVRDGLLGKKSKDIDMVFTNIKPEDLENALKDIGKVDFVGRNFGVYKLWVERKFKQDEIESKNSENENPDEQGKNQVESKKNENKNSDEQQEIDIALPRKEKSMGTGKKNDFQIDANHNYKINDDLSRRDLTINAMAYDYMTGELIDPYNGKNDLLSGQIKTVGRAEDRFSEDYSRILRAIRFAVKLNCKIDKNTWQAICKNAGKMVEKNEQGKQITPYETISKELEKSFTMNPVRTLDLLDKSGILKHILPEIENLKKFEQPKEYHSEGNVYKHTRLVMKALPEGSPFSLVFATLLHDIGKSATYNKDKNDKITFYGHAEKGVRIAEEICDRFKFEKKLKDKILWLIKNHMKMFEVPNMKKGVKIFRILMENEEYSRELLRLNQADTKASIPPEGYADKSAYDKSVSIITELQKDTNGEKIEPLISGNDLIELGMKPGKEFKDILENCYNYQIENNISRKEKLIEYLVKMVK